MLAEYFARSGGFMLAEYFARSGGFMMLYASRVQIGELYASMLQGTLPDRGALC